MTLRRVTASVDRSTGAVFQTFAGRDALLVSVLREAVRRDREWHSKYQTTLAGLQPDAGTLGDLVADYVLERSRSGSQAGAVLRDALVEHGEWPPETGEIVAAGRSMQHAFWKEILSDIPDPDAAAELIVTFVAMESVYAAVLYDDVGYRLLLRSTTAALVTRMMGSCPAASAAMAWANMAIHPTELIEPDAPTAQRLLRATAAAIREEGMAALNLRRIAKLAKTSPSAIAYHFGDLDSFADRAIEWALNSDVPPALRPWTRNPSKNAAETIAFLADMLDASGPDEASPYRGFYISYARIVAQTCLMARQRRGLVRLVRQARFFEGAGIFHASHDSWPADLRLTRTAAAAFAIWIKGIALQHTVGFPGSDDITVCIQRAIEQVR
ncbi:TetR family transcriptional regulator [Sphingomonas sanguinis]|nr:TetR family transcriptional regulator [Sphingomonas sp. LC-1]